MLIGIPPVMTPELLYALAAMGHGDQIAVVDRNYPAAAAGREVIRLAGAGLVEAVDAICSLLPLDTFVAEPVARMLPVGDSQQMPGIQLDILALIKSRYSREVGVEGIERLAFYERARNCFAVVATSEQQPYGCFILTKGVIFPEGSHPCPSPS
jgi:L-fucose mutarotase